LKEQEQIAPPVVIESVFDQEDSEEDADANKTDLATSKSNIVNASDNNDILKNKGDNFDGNQDYPNLLNSKTGPASRLFSVNNSKKNNLIKQQHSPVKNFNKNGKKAKSDSDKSNCDDDDDDDEGAIPVYENVGSKPLANSNKLDSSLLENKGDLDKNIEIKTNKAQEQFFPTKERVSKEKVQSADSLINLQDIKIYRVLNIILIIISCPL
jgi:hypothetical protein